MSKRMERTWPLHQLLGTPFVEGQRLDTLRRNEVRIWNWKAEGV